MKKSNAYQKALARAQHLCAAREYCAMEITEKLKHYALSPGEQEEILNYLFEYQFLDHKRFAKAFVHDKYRFNAWGRLKIRAHLSAKKIAEAVIEQGLAAVDEEEYRQMVYNALERKWEKLNDNDPYKKKSKLFRFAQSRGYEFEIVEHFLEKPGSTF